MRSKISTAFRACDAAPPEPLLGTSIRWSLGTNVWWAIGLILCARSALAHPLGVSPAGPPGSSPNTIPAGGDQGSDGTAASDKEGHPLRPAIRGVETALAVLSAALLIITYATLIGPGTRLSSTSKLPLASMEANIGALLSKAWPDTSASVDVGTAGRGNDNSDAIRLLYLGKMDDDGKRKVARGVEQCEAVQDRAIVAPPMWLTTGSSLTKSMVQLAIWEWVSIWIVMAMMACTLAFNGFFDRDRGPDSYPRLVVVLIYASGYCFHAWYVWRTCKNFFTLVGAGSTWSLLNRAGFASVDRAQLQNRVLSGGPEPGFKQVGKPASGSAYPAFDAYLAHENPGGTGSATAPTVPKAEGSQQQQQQQNRGADDTVNDWHRAEGASTVEAGRIALERIVTNAMTMVGIIVTSGFAAWTSKPTSESSQLGSLALLASLSLGTAAMFSSAVEMSVMETSFRNFLFLKEIMINGKAADHVHKRVSSTRVVGFAHGTVDALNVRTRDLARMCAFWQLALFGPAYALLPTKEDHDNRSEGTNFELNIDVRGRRVVFTTETTSRHCKDSVGRNVEAFNVCCVPPTSSSAPSNGKPALGLMKS